MKMRMVFFLIYGSIISVIIGLIVHELTVNKACYANIIASILLIAGLLIEAISSENKIIKKNEDSGIISALLFGGSVLIIVLCRMFFNVLLLNGSVRMLFFTAGCVLFSTGVLLRYLSRKKLGKYFSYALRIEKEHELIETGIYSAIRHPAYLGAILTLIGVTLMFGAWLGVIFVLGGLIFTIKRINREEIILNNYFGARYERYIMNTKKLIPKIY